MKRDLLVALLGMLLAASPVGVEAQQARPVIGYLGTASLASDEARVMAFRRGLSDVGYVDGSSVTIAFRWAEGQYARLPEQAKELIDLPVSVIFAATLPAALAAKGKTTTTPILFANGNDPVKFGLVASLNKPGGNITGVSFLINALAAKQFELLHEMVRKGAAIGYFVNPNNPNAEVDTNEVRSAARAVGRELAIFPTGSRREIDNAFAAAVQQKAGALMFHADSLLTSQHEHLAMMASRHAIPAVFHLREFAVAGGLISYGGSVGEAYRQTGTYAGRILKGARPADLPVEQSTKVDLVINLKTARALGLAVPPALLARADEVIE